MTDRLLCIGGGLDGKYASSANDFIQLPEHQSSPSETYKLYVAYRKQLFAWPDGDRRFFFVATGLTDEDALDRINKDRLRLR